MRVVWVLAQQAPVAALSLGEPAVGEQLIRVLSGIGRGTGIDSHNRCAHLGLRLLPSCRGKGYGTDAVAVLCHYGFAVRGLHRLQIETLSDNAAMLGAAERNGFVREGVLRSSGWVMGEFLDEVILGLLAQDWKPQTSRGGRAAEATPSG